jgi:hypothetical protein
MVVIVPNKNYLRGRRFEYEVVKDLLTNNPNGFAQRMAGSHSPYDVIGYDPDIKKIWLVQCKTKVINEPKSFNIEDLKISGGWEISTYKVIKYIMIISIGIYV